MKHLLTLSALALFIAFTSSCGKEPSACFKTTNGLDSVAVEGKAYVNVPAYFDGSCSQDATQFKWQFSDQPDSVYYTQALYHTFDSIDTFTVKFTAILGGRESVKEQTVVVVTP